MIKQTQKGFTLIELLVVISIIGMLSSVILTATANARERANDVTVKRNLSSVRQQTALYQSNNNSFGSSVTAGACPTSGTSMFFASAGLRAAIVGAETAGGGATRCATDGANYAVSVKLRSSANHWCVDSTGAVKEITNATWSGVVCP